MKADSHRPYENNQYLEAHLRMAAELDILVSLLETLAWKPSTPDEREGVRVQFARYKSACFELKLLHERLKADNSADSDT
jgi:hypothetical protein